MRDENRQIILSVRVSIPDRKVRNVEPNQCISLPYKVSIPDRKVRNETDDAANGDVQQFQSLIGRFVMNCYWGVHVHERVSIPDRKVRNHVQWHTTISF
ncbi:MAG: hypothetical protein II876_09865, partial [Synergistaceae bacterium]|nr:hypothetical protein [Synergistaceae bacterium]